MNNLKEITPAIAKTYLKQGFSIIPANKDKRPALNGWKQYQTTPMAETETGRHFPAEAIANITGFGNLEVIDVDTKHDKTGDLWPDLWDLIRDNLPDIAPRLVIAGTQSGGKHIYYRCPTPDKNLKLASNLAGETLIETRGSGGYVIAPPSPGYTFEQGSAEEIPTITQQDREILLSVCKSFDEAPDTPTEPQKQGKKAGSVNHGTLSPFEDYDHRGDVLALLERHGWERVERKGNRIHFKRPGNTTAPTSANFHTVKNRFYCFTTSSQFEAGKAYSPTSVFALLECNGDFSEASRRLYELGYGDRHETQTANIDNSLLSPDEAVIFTGTEPQEKQATGNIGDKDPEDIEAELMEAEIKPDEVISEPEACLSITDGNKEINIATLGNFSMIIGKAKSRKTFFVTIAMAAAAKNALIFDRFIGKSYEGKNTVLYIDTEQARHHVYKAFKRVLALSGIEPDQPFKAYCLRKYTPVKRLKMVEHLIYHTPGLKMVVIDGIRDLVTSINDEEQATMMASNLLRWTEEKSIHIICVLHQNKTDQNARGHLGTELQNKAETVLSVSKDPKNKDISIVEAEYCREREPDPFAIEIDGYGLPRLVEDWHPVNNPQRAKKAITPGDFDEEYHRKILSPIFFETPNLKRSELITSIKLGFETRNIRIGNNKARDFLQYYLNNDIIRKEGNDGSPKSYYILTTE